MLGALIAVDTHCLLDQNIVREKDTDPFLYILTGLTRDSVFICILGRTNLKCFQSEQNPRSGH